MESSKTHVRGEEEVSYGKFGTIAVAVTQDLFSGTHERVGVSESMNRDLNRVSVWCNLWGMKLNASKTKTKRVSRSRTVHPQLAPIDSI